MGRSEIQGLSSAAREASPSVEMTDFSGGETTGSLGATNSVRGRTHSNDDVRLVDPEQSAEQVAGLLLLSWHSLARNRWGNRTREFQIAQ